VEICELEDHPWYLGCQFHPEFKSKPLEPHPLFRAFVGAALDFRVARPARTTDVDDKLDEPRASAAHQGALLQ
jgi:CTP synthase